MIPTYSSFEVNTIFNSTLPLLAVLFLFLCFVALRPKSTDMVMAGQSVQLTTLFPGQA